MGKVLASLPVAGAIVPLVAIAPRQGVAATADGVHIGASFGRDHHVRAPTKS